MISKNDYTSGQFIKDIAHYIRPYKGKFFVGLFFRVTSDMARLIPPWAISAIVLLLSTSSGGFDRASITRILLIWGASAAYFTWAHNLSKYFGFQVAENASLDLYKQSLAHLFRLDLAWQEKENSGAKLKKIDKGLDGVNLTIRRIFDTLVEVIVNTVGTILIFTTQDWRLALALAFFIVGYFTVGTVLLKRAVGQERVVNKAFEDLGSLSFESVNNVQTIKALGIDEGILRAIKGKVVSLVQDIKTRITYFQRRGVVLYVFEMVFLLSIVNWIIWGIVNGRYDVSVFILFIGLYRRVNTSAEELTETTQQLALAKIWVSRAMTILRLEPNIENSKLMRTQQTYPEDWKKLTLSHIGFAYKKSHIIQDLSLTIKRGEKIGIVGLSGAGKSTLFKLLLDLYENYEGDISLDGLSLKNIRRQSYIDHVSVVLQDTELFDMSLRENIEIARPATTPSSLSNLEAAIKDSHLDEVVSDLPQGINTLIGEKGFKLSGGQRQRLGIARALYRSPDILLLDEATSHLDAHSEKEIQKALEENISRFTTIVIAHRLSTIKAMDKIVVLEHGKIVEMGSFDSLLKRGGQFAAMWSEQKI